MCGKKNSLTCQETLRQDLKRELLSLADPDYQKFQLALIPNLPSSMLIGVRLPALRKIAKRLAKSVGSEYLECACDDSFEEIMLQGMVIGNLKADTLEALDEIFRFIRRFVPKISNWSVCDSFCAGLKLSSVWPEEVCHFLDGFLKSGREFEIRFGVVMLLNYYVEEARLGNLFQTFDEICRLPGELFYARMAVAWAVSICFVKYPEPTMKYLYKNDMDPFTYKKSLQKIIESRQAEDELKKTIRSMRAYRSPEA